MKAIYDLATGKVAKVVSDEVYADEGAPEGFGAADYEGDVTDALLGLAFDPVAGVIVDPAAALDREWKALRAERDKRLDDCDKYVLPDYPITTSERDAWIAYRQALRDLPENTIDPASPVWPVPPSGA